MKHLKLALMLLLCIILSACSGLPTDIKERQAFLVKILDEYAMVINNYAKQEPTNNATKSKVTLHNEALAVLKTCRIPLDRENSYSILGYQNLIHARRFEQDLQINCLNAMYDYADVLEQQGKSSSTISDLREYKEYMLVLLLIKEGETVL